jgi:large subunit ribosomal protein L18
MKNRLKKKLTKRLSIKARVRKKISGTSIRPRLAVFKSNMHFYAQAIDDENGQTLACASTVEEGGRSIESTKDKAVYVGGTIADRLGEKGIKEVVFDRSGYPYHGNIKLLADTAREKGLKF